MIYTVSRDPKGSGGPSQGVVRFRVDPFGSELLMQFRCSWVPSEAHVDQVCA